MPVSLQADISLSLYKKIIDQVPLFQNTEIGFTKLLALSIKPIIFLKSEYIVKKGDIGSEMFFINRGTVDVVSEDGNIVFASMTEGKFFGEISLIFSVPRTASIRAATNCDLFMLTKKDLDEALSYYPQIAEQIKVVAGSRADKVKKRAQIAKQAESQGASATDAAAAAAKGTSDMEDEGKRKHSSVPAGRRKSLQAELDDLLEIEEDGPTQRFSCTQCLYTCCGFLKTRCWPPLKRVLTFTISHTSHFNTVFSLLSTLLAFISIFTLTFQSIFQVDSPVFFAVNYAFDAYFIAEMILKFHITYEDDQGRAITEFKQVALHYLKQPTGFTLDALASFPFEIVALPIPDPKLRVGVLLYLRLTHTLRLDRVQHFFATEGRKLNQKTVVTRLLKFIVLISLFTQAVACVWYLLACQLQECRPNTWAVKADMYGVTFDPYLHYTNSLYWAVATMTSTGYGELVPTNALEMLFACGVMVFGKLLFGFILGSIASTLANLETRKVQFEEKLSAIKGYMREKNLMSVMQTRVVNYFEYLWSRNKGMDRSGLFQDMPQCMHSEVTLSASEHLLRRVPIFADIETPFLRNLSVIIQPLIFLPGEYIVKKGDIGFGLYLIHHGKVELVDEDMDTVVEVIEEGDYFGQKSLVYQIPREIAVRALTHVDLFLVSREDFDQIVEHHPSAEEHVAKVAKEVYGMPVKKERRSSDVKT
jgi:CRP-like cAMP-binding protein